MAGINEFTVIFLINNNPPDKVILLKRAANKKFAPGFYTGIGGKVGDLSEFINESVLESAYRELSEETKGKLNKDNINLKEFARCIFESGLKLYYFWSIYNANTLPKVFHSEGILAWVSTGDLLQQDIIPTTKAVCEEWSKREFFIDKPFTIYVREVGKENTVRLVEIKKVENGLL